MSETPYTLHVWPAKWNLQSLDPTCLAAVLYLQLTIPGKFNVAPCSNPDQSPNGQLPYLTHGHVAVSTFPSIVAFVASLAKSSGAVDLDASLTNLERAQRTALYAHVEACIGDLVSHMFYGVDANFWGLTNPALASDMSVPQKYYVASRIRQTYRPRLEAAGLWGPPCTGEEKKGLFEKDKKKKRDYKVTFARAFEREKILDKAKMALEVHANRLDGKQFFLGDRPTSLDVYLAAHMLLLADPPFPDAVLQIHLLESYPGLIDHARRIQAEVARAPPYEHVAPSASVLGSLFPRSLFGTNSPRPPVDPADIQYRRRSMLFVLGAVAMSAFYVYNVFSVVSRAKELKEDKEGEGEEVTEAPEFSDVEDDSE